MNVLHLISGRGPTGPAAAAMSDVRALLSAGHSAWLAAGASSALPEICRAEGLPYIAGMKLGRGFQHILNAPSDVRHLRSLIRDLRVDVLHVHRSDDQILGSVALTHKFSTRLIRTWHRDPALTAKPLLSKFASQVEGCVCVSRQHAQTLRSAGAPRCRFMHAAVDTSVFAPLPEPRAGGSSVILGQVGRWKRDRKGHDRGQRAALDIFARLSQKKPWRGLLVGRGEMADVLRNEAYSERGLSEERVVLVNFAKQSRREFASMIGSFHLGLIFTPGSDGTSRAGAEMLACGVPLLVADLPGLRELAEDEACALLLAPNDPSGWASAIENLLGQPERLIAMSKAARLRAESAHTSLHRGQALADFYSDA